MKKAIHIKETFGLELAKKLKTDWLLIIDGDEVYDEKLFPIIKNLTKQLEKQNVYASYFESITFVNDLWHFTIQEFPRLFKVTPECMFVNDNFMQWDNASWTFPFVTKNLNVKYHHYAFCKNLGRFDTKLKWWNSRGLGPNFDYGWKINEKGLIEDDKHKIYSYTGKHPSVMQSHEKFNLRKY